MNDDLRARIARSLEAIGITGYRDNTNTRLRPQWRASFNYNGEIHSEKAYVHVYVPSDGDQLQVNSTAPSPALNSMPMERLRDELAAINASCVPGSPDWDKLLSNPGVAPADVSGWEATIAPHQGFESRMMLGRVTMPLAAFSDDSLDLAIRLGLSLARLARESLVASWESSQTQDTDDSPSSSS